MNRATRDKFASGTNQADLTTGNACWETPPAIFDALDAEFHFDVDLTADAARAKCRTWLGPGSTHGLHAHDAIAAPWACYGDTGYSNPPYGRFVGQMLAKAKWEADKGFTSVLLLPMRVTVAFRAHVLRGAAELRFCDKRITFWENGAPRINPRTGKPDPALFDSIVVVYRPGISDPRVSVWQVPPHVPKQLAKVA
jgi:phage N-6-adenine-methyltransferase